MMIEIKCETVEEDGDDFRKVTIFINGQPVWARKMLTPSQKTEDHTDTDIQSLAWLREAIRQQLTDVDTEIKNKIQELREC